MEHPTMNPFPSGTENKSILRQILRRILRRVDIAFGGWLSAVPFVLAGPVLFWLLFTPIQISTGSWHDLFDTYRAFLPPISAFAIAHLLLFFILGMPLFVIFWEKKSIIWRLPISILLGLALGAITGIPLYAGIIAPADIDAFFICLGYGAGTAFGCWLANRRNERQIQKPNPASLSISLGLFLILIASIIVLYVDADRWS